MLCRQFHKLIAEKQKYFGGASSSSDALVIRLHRLCIHESIAALSIATAVVDYKDTQPVQDYNEAAHSGSLFALCSVLLVCVQEMW